MKGDDTRLTETIVNYNVKNGEEQECYVYSISSYRCSTNRRANKPRRLGVHQSSETKELVSPMLGRALAITAVYTYSSLHS